jgi:hypothetical protein
MAVFLEMRSDRLDPGDLDTLVRDMNESLRAAADVEAERPRVAPEAGDRGALSVVGKLILDFVGTSASAELIKVLGSYFNREKSLEGKITFADGTTIEVNAKNLSDGDFEHRLTSMINATRSD